MPSGTRNAVWHVKRKSARTKRSTPQRNILRDQHLSGPSLSSRKARSWLFTFIRLRQFFRYGESCVLCRFSVNWVTGKYLVAYNFRLVVAVTLSYWADFGFQTDDAYLPGARLVAKLVCHVDVLVTDITREREQRYEIPCFVLSLQLDFGRLHDKHKPKMETAYTSTVIWYGQAATVFRESWSSLRQGF